jgi:hypothetical protein
MSDAIGSEADLFNKLKSSISIFDPVKWIEEYLTIDGKSFNLSSGGWKPFADIYRYVGMKSLDPKAPPMVLLKSRQTGGTVMASAIELFFMGSELFGKNNKPPMRIIHAFPALAMAKGFSKTKFTPMVETSKLIPDPTGKGKKGTPYIKTLLDKANDSQEYKAFTYGNHIWIDSTGITGDRLRGKTVDAIFFDECFPYEQEIVVQDGTMSIGKLVDTYLAGGVCPLVKTYNEDKGYFELSPVTKVWKREPRWLAEVSMVDGGVFRCTPNHRLLTDNGWKQVHEMGPGSRIKSYIGYVAVDSVEYQVEKATVYDIEVAGSHNFIIKTGVSGLIAHNCQDMTEAAITNSTKMLNQAQYGQSTKGIQLYFGTPKQNGSNFHKLWSASTQQYYHLGCERCKETFPFYTYGSNEWEKIWIDGFIVECPKCGQRQDKREAAARGKWVATCDLDTDERSVGIKYIGFHINQLYMPHVEKKHVIAEKPENHPINTERAYRNEVLGEFHNGSATPITLEEIRDLCGLPGETFRRFIPPNECLVTIGIDYGQMNDLERIANPDEVQGKSYTCAVVLAEIQKDMFLVAHAKKFQRNDIDSKIETIASLIQTFNANIVVGDIGYSNDISEKLQTIYGDRCITSRAGGRLKNNVKFDTDCYPHEIKFDKDYFYNQTIERMKQGMIKFPLGYESSEGDDGRRTSTYDRIYWLMEHCSNLDLKTVTINGLQSLKFVKRKGKQTDGFAALVNAYLGNLFIKTKGFEEFNPLKQVSDIKGEKKPLILTGYLPR